MCGPPAWASRSALCRPTLSPAGPRIPTSTTRACPCCRPASAALEGGRTVVPTTLQAQQLPLCLELENNLFKAAFAAGLFPDRPAYADSGCSVAAKSPSYLKTGVGVLTLGPIQLAYSPGEV